MGRKTRRNETKRQRDVKGQKKEAHLFLQQKLNLEDSRRKITYTHTHTHTHTRHTHTHTNTVTHTDTDNRHRQSQRERAREKGEREKPVSQDQDGLARQQLVDAVPVCIRQHTSAYVSIRQHTSVRVCVCVLCRWGGRVSGLVCV